MLNFSMIELLRKNGRKFDKEIKSNLIQFYKPFRLIPCFLQRPFETLRKRTKKIPVIIEFEDGCFTSGLQEVKQTRCRNLREFPSISSCSGRFTYLQFEQLINSCSDIKKIHFDRQVTTLLDNATPSVRSNIPQDNGWTGKDVTIAILDTGIYPHDDLEGRIVGFKGFTSSQVLPYDDNGHGTHCAGDAAGDGALSEGKYKVPASDANVVGLKVLNKMGSGSLSTVIEGIEWCIENQNEYNIDILSISLGTNATESAEDDPVVKAVNTAWDRGIIVVAAAGNSGPQEQTISSPGISPKIITVGAVDHLDNTDRSDEVVADFSSRGPTIDGFIKPDLVTPGVNVTSLRAPNSFIDRTNKTARVDSNYISLSGTSMATPICAGVIAQLLQKNPHLSPDDVKQRLLNACDNLGQPSNVQGSGYLNAEKLLGS